MSTTLKHAMSSRPMTVRTKDELSAAYLRMKREGFRHLPVIDDEGRLVGIISDRDFQRAMEGSADNAAFPPEAKVAQFMSRPVTALGEETPILEAVRLMIEKKISAIAVTRSDQMTGIITHEDLLRILAVLLEEPASIKEKVTALTYSSPLSQVTDLLALAGV